MTERLTLADSKRGSFAVDTDPLTSVGLPRIGMRVSSAVVPDVQNGSVEKSIAEIDSILGHNPKDLRLALAGVVDIYEEMDVSNTDARRVRDPLFLVITRNAFKQGRETPGYTVFTASEMVPRLNNAAPNVRVDYLTRRGFARLQNLLTPVR